MQTFTDVANELRSEIKATGKKLMAVADETKGGVWTAAKAEDWKEMIANLMLTYRHLEDASMRLGKAIQAHDGGVSVYDKDTTIGA